MSRRPWWQRVAAIPAAMVVVLSVLSAALVAPVGSAGPQARAAPLRYVALGDSYTSGPLIPYQLADPSGCHRSDHNYSHLTALALGLLLTDMSCSGATIADLGSPQATGLGVNPPQIDAVTSATSVVTLGIGGNDIDFSTILGRCLALLPSGPTAVGPTCQGYYDAGHDQLAAAVDALAPEIAAALAGIRHRAPHATVLVVGYPAILPPAGQGCWPQMPLTIADVSYLRSVELDLNSMLEDTARASRAGYVDTYDPSVGHNACTPEATRWVEPILPESPAYPVHPNANGEEALAGLVEAALGRAGIS